VNETDESTTRRAFRLNLAAFSPGTKLSESFMRRILLLCCGCFYLTSLVAGAAEQRPNVVVLLADDLGSKDIGCYGERNIPGLVAFLKLLEDVPDDPFRRLILDARVLNTAEK